MLDWEWRLETTDTTAVLAVWAGAHRAQELQWLRGVQRVRLKLHLPDGQLLEPLELVPTLSGMADRSGEQTSLALHAKVSLQSTPARIPGRVWVQYEVETSAGTLRGSQWVERQHRSGALLLLPDILVGNGGVEFRLRVRRVQEVEGEYFPSSERLRVEVFQGVKRLWSSDAGVAFLQVIGAVEPVAVGMEHVYQYRWNGRLNTGQELSAGIYEVRLTLPARPFAYGVTVPLYWRGLR